jgi:hypothetical protein
MNLVLLYIDGIILAISIVFAYIYTLKITRHAALHLRKIALFFVLLGIFAIIMNMVGHLSEIAFRAIQRVIAGNFVYDFHFYSLLLMGAVFLSIGLYMLGEVKKLCMGNTEAKMKFIKAAIVMSLISAPTFPFTPIGLLPTLACILSLVALRFALKQENKKPQLQRA